MSTKHDEERYYRVVENLRIKIQSNTKIRVDVNKFDNCLCYEQDVTVNNGGIVHYTPTLEMISMNINLEND